MKNRPIHTKRVVLYLLILQLILLSSCCSGSDTIVETDYSRHIPFLNKIHIDGNSDDWPDSNPSLRILSDVYGDSPDSSDMFARFRLGWDQDGLLILAEVSDDSIYEDHNRFWNGDGIELFISPSRGSFEIMQVSVRPSYDLPDSLTSVMYYDHRRTDSLRFIIPESEFCSYKSSTGYRIEGRIPFKMLGISSPEPGMEIAVQLYINDSDMEGDSTSHSLPWYPVRGSYKNPYAFHKVILSESATLSVAPELRAYIIDDKTLHLKILSENPYREKHLKVIGGELNKPFNLHRENDRLYTRSWELPLKKISFDNQKLFLCWNDSVFFGIDLCLLHRVYKDIAKPDRFEDEIRIFEIIDHFRPPPRNAILFTGSSTIRKWNNLENDLPGIDLINRGFGGSTMKDLNYYRERIVFPYNPSRIYVYEGDNDIARGTSPIEFTNDCIEFIQACKKQIPDAEIYFMSIKPSLSRLQNWKDMQEANRMLEELTGQFDRVYYIDISSYMLTKEGTPKKDIFESDRLHLNKYGYFILAKALYPSLYVVTD